MTAAYNPSIGLIGYTDADELPEPQDLAAEAITEPEAVVDDLREMLTLLEQSASEVPAS